MPARRVLSINKEAHSLNTQLSDYISLCPVITHPHSVIVNQDNMLLIILLIDNISGLPCGVEQALRPVLWQCKSLLNKT